MYLNRYDMSSFSQDADIVLIFYIVSYIYSE